MTVEMVGPDKRFLLEALNALAIDLMGTTALSGVSSDPKTGAGYTFKIS